MEKKIIIISVVSAMFAFFGATATAQVSSIETGEVAINAPATGDTKTTDGSPWMRGGVAGINFSQVSLTNWAAGGDGAVAFDLLFNYNANYRKEKHLWQNRLELAYGMNYSGSRGAQKTNDKIYLASLYGYELGRNWFLSGLLNFNTQFANGYDYTSDPKTFMSQFMAPGYLSVGLGVTWMPKSWFTATFSPATWRGTFVLNDQLSDLGMFGVDPGKKMRNEFGANVRFEVNYDLTESINFYSRLDLYSNYLENPQNVDVRWDIMLTASITKWLSANLTINMIYDDDIKFPQTDGTLGGPKFQVKEVLGIGLQASF